MNIDASLNSLEKVAPYVLITIKWAVVIAMAGYVIFSAIVIRQVKLMLETVRVGFEAPIKLISIGLMLFGVVVLVTALLL